MDSKFTPTKGNLLSSKNYLAFAKTGFSNAPTAATPRGRRAPPVSDRKMSAAGSTSSTETTIPFISISRGTSMTSFSSFRSARADL